MSTTKEEYTKAMDYVDGPLLAGLGRDQGLPALTLMRNLVAIRAYVKELEQQPSRAKAVREEKKKMVAVHLDFVHHELPRSKKSADSCASITAYVDDLNMYFEKVCAEMITMKEEFKAHIVQDSAELKKFEKLLQVAQAALDEKNKELLAMEFFSSAPLSVSHRQLIAEFDDLPDAMEDVEACFICGDSIDDCERKNPGAFALMKYPEEGSGDDTCFKCFLETTSSAAQAWHQRLQGEFDALPSAFDDAQACERCGACYEECASMPCLDVALKKWGAHDECTCFNCFKGLKD